jgi:hypothetical protein
MVAYIGNSIPAPSYTVGGTITDEEILYSTHNYVQKGVTLKPGQGVLLAGTFLDQDATSKQYVKTTTAANVKGVLRKTTDTGQPGEIQVWQANILYAGLVKLSAVSSANSGVTLTNVLAGKVDTVAGFFRF